MIENERFQKRSKNFQKTLQPSDIKRKHSEFVVTLRKNKRAECLKKKRYDLTSIDSNAPEEMIYLGICSETMVNYFPEIPSLHTELDKLKYLTGILKSTGIPDFIILEILVIFRISLSKSIDHLHVFIEEGLIPVISSYISQEFIHEISSEAMWCMCNLAVGPSEYVQEMYKCGIISKIFTGIASGNTELVSNSLWTAANIIGDCWDFCREILEKDFLVVLSQLPCEEDSLVKGIGFCLANISMHDEHLEIFQCTVILNLIKEIIERDLAQCLQAIYYLVRKDNQKIQLAINSGLIKYAASGLQMGQNFSTVSAQIIGAVASGTNMHTQYLLDLDILTIFSKILNAVDVSTSKFMYWALSNIAAGSHEHRITIAKHKILELGLQGLVHYDANVRMEASFFLKNFLKLASLDQKIKVVEYGVFKIIAENLKGSETACMGNTLEICRLLLEISRYADLNVLEEFESSGCLNGLVELTHHLNTEISSSSANIIDTYFS